MTDPKPDEDAGEEPEAFVFDTVDVEVITKSPLMGILFLETPEGSFPIFIDEKRAEALIRQLSAFLDSEPD